MVTKQKITQFIDNLPDGVKNAVATLAVAAPLIMTATATRKNEIAHFFERNQNDMIVFGEGLVGAAAIIAGGYYVAQYIRSSRRTDPS